MSRAELIINDRESYDGHDRANFSKIKHLDKSPAHYMHEISATREDSPAMRVGRASHLAVLEPTVFASDVVAWDGGRRAGGEWKAFEAKHVGREILTVDEFATCRAIAASVRSSPHAMQYLESGQAETTALWTDAVTGVECKGRIDWISEAGALVDLKTTRDASPDGFGRQSWASLYHAQAAFYQDAVYAATGERLPFVIVAVENAAPFVTQVYTVPREAIDIGRRAYRTWLARLVECRAAGRWPGYLDAPTELAIPRWAERVGESADDAPLELDV